MIHALRFTLPNINPKIPLIVSHRTSSFDAYFTSTRLTTNHYRSKRLRPAEEILLLGL
jgi:hypothetical protein